MPYRAIVPETTDAAACRKEKGGAAFVRKDFINRTCQCCCYNHFALIVRLDIPKLAEAASSPAPLNGTDGASSQGQAGSRGRD